MNEMTPQPLASGPAVPSPIAAASPIDGFFCLTERGTSVGREVMAGATTFAAMSGTDPATYTRERPGISAFALEDGVVYHTYSAYSRGVDGLWGMYQWLDRAPKGRNEMGVWWRRHDEYGTQDKGA